MFLFKRTLLLTALAVAAALAPGLATEARAEPFYPTNIPTLKQGDFIFFHNKVFEKPQTPEQEQWRKDTLEYIKRFRICLTNGYANFEGEELKDLQAAGCEFFIYRWFNAYYKDELVLDDASKETYYNSYPEMIDHHREIHKHPEWLLNPENPMQGAGAVLPAYFFDFNNPEFRAFFVESIRRDLEKTGYDGVFFDYIGGWALPAEVIELWNKKYPNKTYDEAGIEFLTELRAALGTKRIFGNQAYRLPEGYYDLIDYDATESHGTSFVWGKEAELYMRGKGLQKTVDSYIRTWDGPGGYKEISAERRAMTQKKPKVKICDINYLQSWRVPTGAFAETGDMRKPVFVERRDRPAIFYSYAISKLEDGAVFASDWYTETGAKDDVYFLDLGKPLDETYTELTDVVVRYYENGFVVVTRSNGRVEFKPDAAKIPAGTVDVWDVFQGIRVWDWASNPQVAIDPTWYASTETYYPSGRVFMYLKSQSAQ